MSSGLLDLFIVIVLILANGAFSMAEIAVISARKTRLQQMADEGDIRAAKAMELARSPNLFLSTVQVGITLVGVLSGAFGGAKLSLALEEVLPLFPFLEPYRNSICFSVVVLLITYLSLVLGELVPKRLAMSRPEGIASRMAPSMRRLSTWTSPVITMLSASTEGVLRLIGFRQTEESPVSEEEIRILIEQGTVAGIFQEAEQEMIDRVFRLGDRAVAVLMTPRKKIVWLDVNDPADKLRRKIAHSPFAHLPVCQGKLTNILGVVRIKDVLHQVLEGRPIALREIAREPLFVLENTHVLKLMELFREKGAQMAFVVDEYGTIEGIVTLKDLLESLIGEVPSPEETEEPMVVHREDGSLLIDGTFPIDEFKDLFHLKRLPDEESGFQTLGGFVMTHLGKIPKAGDRFECCGVRVEVMDMDGRRVDKVLVEALEVEDGTGNGGEGHPE